MFKIIKTDCFLNKNLVRYTSRPNDQLIDQNK